MFDILADSFRIATRTDDWRPAPRHRASRRSARPDESRRIDRRFLEISWLMLGRR